MLSAAESSLVIKGFWEYSVSASEGIDLAEERDCRIGEHAYEGDVNVWGGGRSHPPCRPPIFVGYLSTTLWNSRGISGLGLTKSGSAIMAFFWLETGGVEHRGLDAL